MAAVQTYGQITNVRNIGPGKIFVLPTSKGTALAMILGYAESEIYSHLAWLSDAPNPGEKRFDLIDITPYRNNAAMVVDDVAFRLSTERNHLVAYEGRLGAGAIVQSGASFFINLGSSPNSNVSIDILTGLRGKGPSEDGSCLASTSWSLVRSYQDGSVTKISQLCEWSLN